MRYETVNKLAHIQQHQTNTIELSPLFALKYHDFVCADNLFLK